MTPLSAPLPRPIALSVRLIAGAAAGLFLAYLIETAPGVGGETFAQSWRGITASAVALGIFVLWAGAAAMRVSSLVAWTTIALILLVLTGWHEEVVVDGAAVFLGTASGWLIIPFLFIAHELVSSADQARRWIAPYETYFDEAWLRGVQLVMAIVFAILFWGILALGAVLLGFIGFDWLKELLDEVFFNLPVIGLALAAAVNLGDVQPKLLASVRGLGLGVLSWLLPVITTVGVVFAVSLLFSGLAPLWATNAATATLLSACVGFVLLINAAYQQGDVERSVHVVLKWCVRAAALLLLVFAVLAAWSLWLRIDQYGLTPARVMAALAVVIALAYGLAYSAAAVWPGRWMRGLEPANIGLAVFKAACFLAVMTPVAAPARLGVADQMARLERGVLSVETLDWWLLADKTGTYGERALEALSKGDDPALAAKAKLALADNLGPRPVREDAPAPDQPPKPDLSNIPVVLPKGGALPASFLATDFRQTNGGSMPGCLRFNGDKDTASCSAALLDLNDDGKPEVLIGEGSSLAILTERADGWVGNVGYLDLGGDAALAFERGEIASAPAAWRDVIVGGKRIPSPAFPDPRAAAPSQGPPAP